MKTILKVQQGDRCFYVMAERFLAKYKIQAVLNDTNESLNTNCFNYILTEIVNGKLLVKPLGYISDITPGNYSLAIRLNTKHTDPSNHIIQHFDLTDICVLEQIYSFL